MENCMMAKKPETFAPELDGKGRILCPVDSKMMTRINKRYRNSVLSDALKEALAKGPNVEANRHFAAGRVWARMKW